MVLHARSNTDRPDRGPGLGPSPRGETFVRRRRLTLDGEYVEVAHEALLGAWPRLAQWLEEDSVGRVVRRRLAPDAVEWDREGRPWNSSIAVPG